MRPRRTSSAAPFAAALDAAKGKSPQRTSFKPSVLQSRRELPHTLGAATPVRSTPSPLLLADLLRAAGDEPVDAQDAGQWAALINEKAARHGVDPTLVAAVTRAESSFNPQAVSRAGAKGLMQLMDPTARILGVLDSFDPVQNVDGGTRYLAEMLRRFPSPEIALAAYNAGPNAVARYGGVPPFKETQTYVRRVLDYQQQMRANQL